MNQGNFPSRSQRSLGRKSPRIQPETVTFNMSVSRLPLLRKSALRRTIDGSGDMKRLRGYEGRTGINRFTVMRTIGTGSFARVKLAVDRGSGEVVVLKSMSKFLLIKRKQIAHVLSEKKLLARLSSPFLLALKGTFQDEYRLHLVLEFVPGGELYHLLSKTGTVSPTDALIYAAELVCALSYLHSEHIVYRDLKPENVLITSTGHIKLADFGFAKQVKPQEKAYTLCGTPHCLAPEVIQYTGHTYSCDWWALGIILYEMLSGTTPFKGTSPYHLYRAILTEQVEFPSQIEGSAKDLISNLLVKDPERRATETDIRSHAFFHEVDWTAAAQMQLQPHYIPNVQNPLDTSHFDKYPERDEVLDDCKSTDPSIFRDF